MSFPFSPERWNPPSTAWTLWMPETFFLEVSDRVDDAGMEARPEDHQASTFYVYGQPLVVVKKVRVRTGSIQQ
jgi:hypothetical protein